MQGGAARAPDPAAAARADRVVPLSPKMVGLRFAAAGRSAGVERVTTTRGEWGWRLNSRAAARTRPM